MTMMLSALKREQRRVRRELVDADRIAALQAEAKRRTRATNYNEFGWSDEAEQKARPQPRRRGNGSEW